MSDREKPDTLMVFCGKSLGTLKKAGGCGDWKLDRNRTLRMSYVVAVRNHRAPWSELDVPHGVAWFVGTVEDVVEAAGGRWLVKIGRYALVDVAHEWGSRNPVKYARLQDLRIDPATLHWETFLAARPSVADASVKSTAFEGAIQPLTFEQAKQGLAAAMGVLPEQIEITIRA